MVKNGFYQISNLNWDSNDGAGTIIDSEVDIGKPSLLRLVSAPTPFNLLVLVCDEDIFTAAFLIQ